MFESSSFKYPGVCLLGILSLVLFRLATLRSACLIAGSFYPVKYFQFFVGSIRIPGGWRVISQNSWAEPGFSVILFEFSPSFSINSV